jgi:hypothetical protein
MVALEAVREESSMRRRRRRHHGIQGLSGYGSELGQGAIALGVGAVGFFLQRAATPFLQGMFRSPIGLALGGSVPTLIAGLIGGALLSRRSPAAGFGFVGGVAAPALVGAIEGVIHMESVAPVSGLRAYPWTRRYGVHGLRQMDPYAIRMPLQGLGQGQIMKPQYYGWGLGRTRVIEQEPRGYEMNGLGAGYSYHSSAVRLHG